ncbi:MAG TPA: hypothetical protein VET23_05360 [Chitinophagaceae bacterium]|nr:hypothetical protein [Chitinophagaceae bacterium]
MEVHHHPHAEKKGFKEYFLEFLMIFLAVTLGFFAENIRESIRDKKQLYEYIESMVNDLQSDTALYHSAVEYNLSKCRIVDTIIQSLSDNDKSSNNAQLYLLVRQLTMGTSVISTTAKTFDQMKSSGGLRLIGKQSTTDSIGSYYQWTQRFEYWSDFQKQRLNEVISINDRVFDSKVLFSILKKMENDSGPFIPENNPKLISQNPISINAVIMRYQYYYGFLKLMNERSMLALSQASRLIALLKKEYHLE